jgi:hypothetical protein
MVVPPFNWKKDTAENNYDESGTKIESSGNKSYGVTKSSNTGTGAEPIKEN